MSGERLDKMIASRSAMTRSEVRRAVKDGAVLVNGVVATDCSVVLSGSNSITLYGKPFLNEKHIYIMLNKPRGVVSATRDGRDKTVIDLVPPELYREGLFPAGRLDADTTGFVLITDDGDFAHRILSPKSHVIKTYNVLARLPVTPQDIERFSNGIELKDGTRCLPAQLEALDGCAATVRICEGRYHQIKRMFAACGNEVLELCRTQIGATPLDTALAQGECRLMTQQEVENAQKR